MWCFSTSWFYSEEQNSEGHFINNPSLRGYEVIDEAKAELEAHCPQTVSCADILAFAARDSAYLLWGIKYALRLGRWDGLVSLIHEPPLNLPAPFFDLQLLHQFFKTKGLSLEEMVTLSGAHSIGVSNCSAVTPRLYPSNNSNPRDPLMDPIKQQLWWKSFETEVIYGLENSLKLWFVWVPLRFSQLVRVR